MKNLTQLITEIVISEKNVYTSNKKNFKVYVSLVESINALSTNDLVKLRESIAKQSDLKARTIEKQFQLLLNAFNKGIDLSKYSNFYSLTKINKLIENGAKIVKGILTEVDEANEEIKRMDEGRKKVDENEMLEIKKTELFRSFIKEMKKGGFEKINIVRAINSELS